MAYGYGPVAGATFIGFFLGIAIWVYYSSTYLTRVIGYFLIFIGILGMMLNQKVLTGIPGGVATGIGLGITFMSSLITC